MVTDFVRRNKNGAASTEVFFAIANDRIPQTPLAKKYGYKDLNWFLQQWVFGTNLRSYRLDYQIENHSDGKFAVKGPVIQEGISAKEEWITPLALVIHFGGNKVARGTIAAYGAKISVSIELSARPEKVELAPDHWILSHKTVRQKTSR